MSALPQEDSADLEAALADGLARLIEHADAELAVMNRERQELEARIDLLKRRRAVWESSRRRLAMIDTPVDREGWQLRLVEDERLPSKRQAVLSFLNEHPRRTFKLVEIRRALIERGWMTDDRASVHSLEVAVRGMEARGEVTRPRKGIYKLAEPAGSAQRLP